MTGLIDIDIIMAAQSGNDDAKVAICKSMIPVIRKKAWYIPPEWKDDAIQAGILGILVAITKFDPALSENFDVFAGYYAANEIAALHNSCIGICRIPRRIMQMYRETKKNPEATVLPNGIRVDDIERLISYTRLTDAS